MDWILERCGSCWISMFHCYVRLSKATSLQTCRFYVRTIYSTFSKHGCKKDGGKLPSIFTEAARGVGQRIVYGSSMGGPCATSTLEKLCTTHLQMVLRYTLIIYIYHISNYPIHSSRSVAFSTMDHRGKINESLNESVNRLPDLETSWLTSPCC